MLLRIQTLWQVLSFQKEVYLKLVRKGRTINTWEFKRKSKPILTPEVSISNVLSVPRAVSAEELGAPRLAVPIQVFIGG